MFEEEISRYTETNHACLLDFYDDLRELNRHVFFFCDAISSMLSPDFSLDAETIAGVRLAADELKTRSKQMVTRMCDFCDEVRWDALDADG